MRLLSLGSTLTVFEYSQKLSKFVLNPLCQLSLNSVSTFLEKTCCGNLKETKTL